MKVKISRNAAKVLQLELDKEENKGFIGSCTSDSFAW